MNAILYARFSPRPDEEKCESADKQIERCSAWAIAMNHTIVATERDEARSGASMEDRPGLQRALERTLDEKGMLVVTAIDRIGRDTIDVIRTSKQLTKAGACWASLSESIDTSSPTGRFMVAVFAAMAEMEREQIAERTRIGMQKLQAAGWAVSKRLPTGRRLASEQPSERLKGMPSKALLTEPAPEELAALARAQELRSLHFSWRMIAQTLNDEGRVFRGGRWTHTTIYRAIRPE